MVLNIVSDSFKEMNDEFKKADLYLNIPKSKYNPLKIKKSTLVFETEYTNYFRELLNLWYKQNKNNSYLIYYCFFFFFFIFSINNS